MLDPTEFRRILHNGLGRAILYLRDHDATPHRETILYACLHDTVFDRLMNPSNADYIYEVLGLTGDVEFYRAALLDGLRKPDEDFYLGQICDLLKCFAQQGDVAARRALYEAFDRDAANDGARFAIVALDGLPGFLHIANGVGEAAATDQDFWEGAYFLSQLEDRYGAEIVQKDVTSALANNPRIAAYIAAIEKRQQRPAPSARVRFDPKTMEYDELKTIVANKGRWSAISLRQWGRQASDADMARLADDVLAEANLARLHIYLRVFAERPFPRGHEPLLRFVDSPDRRVIETAIDALSNFEHPDIRALALSLLQSRLWATLNLLAHNFQEGDYRLIEAAMGQIAGQNDEKWHWVEIALHHLVDRYPSVAATNSLLLLYEHGQCSLCRHGAIKALHQLGTLPEAIRHECEFDADFGLRANARRHFREEAEGTDSSLRSE